MTNTNEILEQIKVPKDKYTKEHAGRLPAIYKFFSDNINEVTEVMTDAPIEMKFGRKTEEKTDYRTGESTTRTWSEGQPTKAVKFYVVMKNGNYSALVPMGTTMYSDMCTLLKVKPESPLEQVVPSIKYKFTCPAEMLQSIARAKPFASKDGHRPNAMCILIEIVKGQAQVICTDCHTMYISKKYKVHGSEKKHQFLLPAAAVKGLPKKLEYDTFEFDVMDTNTVKFAGIEVALETEAKYMNWKVVVPEYDKGMTFDRLKFMAKIKEVLPASNKSTNAVSCYLNGDISLHTQDVDFSTESNARMAYISKEMPDLKIAFNGKMLLTMLKGFNSGELTMLSNGKNDRAALFTDGIETVLQMPLMYHDEPEYESAPAIEPEPAKPEPEPVIDTIPNNDQVVAVIAQIQGPADAINSQNKACLLFCKYLEFICSNYSTVVLHQYTDRLTVKYMRLGASGIMKGSHTVNLTADRIAAAMPGIESVAAFFEKPIIKK